MRCILTTLHDFLWKKKFYHKWPATNAQLVTCWTWEKLAIMMTQFFIIFSPTTTLSISINDSVCVAQINETRRASEFKWESVFAMRSCRTRINTWVCMAHMWAFLTWIVNKCSKKKETAEVFSKQSQLIWKLLWVWELKIEFLYRNLIKFF